MTIPKLPHLTAADVISQSKILAQAIAAQAIAASAMRRPLLSAAYAVCTKPKLTAMLHLNPADCNLPDHHWRHENMSCSTNQEGDLYIVGDRTVLVGIN